MKIKIKWNPFNNCWEFWNNRNLLETCDPDELREVRKKYESS